MRKNNIGTRSIKGQRFVNLRRRVLSAAILAASQTAWVTHAMSGTEGGREVDGAGSIGRDGRNNTIQQRTNRMVVDWDSYNVAADEVVTYVQPGRDSVALNRILSHSGSDIHGQINANGQVVVVNPHGVFFGENAQVNVGGLIASGMTVDVSDFMNGDFTFSRSEDRKSTRLNSSHVAISYAVFCLKIKNE